MDCPLLYKSTHNVLHSEYLDSDDDDYTKMSHIVHVIVVRFHMKTFIHID